ncbi:unnamed protein product, partial [Ectocarpus sp. 6 AP-2014]
SGEVLGHFSHRLRRRAGNVDNEGRSGVFLQGQKEIAKMLAETCSVSSRPPLSTRKSLSSFCSRQTEPQAKL